MVVMNSCWNKYVLFYDTFGACIVHSEWLNTLAATIWNKSNKILTDRFKQFSLHCLTNNFFWNHVISCGSDGKGIVRHNHLYFPQQLVIPWPQESSNGASFLEKEIIQLMIWSCAGSMAWMLLLKWLNSTLCKGTTSRADSEVVNWFF